MVDQDVKKLFFFDIETVPSYSTYDDLPERMKPLWEAKYNTFREPELPMEESFFDRGGIFAEFGKIICISMGFFHGDSFRLKSIYGDDEHELLSKFGKAVSDMARSVPGLALCGHNIKEFDVPYVCRRMLVHGLRLPGILNIAGKKPWEVNHLDTMELWKFGDWKSYTSLNLLAALFNIPTPKDDISGADVGRVYWMNKDLERIVEYCQKDVLTTAQLMLRYKGMDLIAAESIVYVE